MSNIKEKLQTLLDSIPEEKLKDILNQLQPSTADKTKIAHDFLFNACQGMTLKMTGDQEITYYNKANEWLFQQDYKNNTLWYSYRRIYKFLRENCLTDKIDTHKFIEMWVETNLHWQGLSPHQLCDNNLNDIGVSKVVEGWIENKINHSGTQTKD